MREWVYAEQVFWISIATLAALTVILSLILSRMKPYVPSASERESQAGRDRTEPSKADSPREGEAPQNP